MSVGSGEPTGLEPAEAGPAFADLPDEVLAHIASLGLTDAHDVASFAGASKQLAAVCRAAPLRLAVAVRGAAPREEQHRARAALHALCASWPGTAELDLRGSPLEDGDIDQALESLPSLASLQLSGCKKLTPVLTASLARRPQLRSITLQRCFQLTAASLTDVLAAAAQPGSRLACAALSHMSLQDWPEGEPGGCVGAAGGAPARGGAAAEAEAEAEAAPALAPAAAAPAPAAAAAAAPPAPLRPTRLRMLALHCTKVSSGALWALAGACPHLEVLMLGGAVLALADDVASLASAGTSAAAAAAAAPGTLKASAAGASNSAHAAQAVRFYRQAEAAVLGGAPSLGAGYGAYVAGVAAQLALLVLRLPRLQVLELTFALPGLAQALQQLARTEPSLLEGRPEPVQMWDLAQAAAVQQALQWRHDVQRRHCAGGAGITPSDAAAFLAAAANCSSGGRQTPLHAAAEEANPNPAHLRALLGLGAAVDARDRSGASALFAACEAGHLRTVECLLAAGASATLRNSAGEAPLYIAALKGHERVLDLLLQHCQERGIGWQAQRLYDGDGWTPLMAACLAPPVHRTSIVLKLLQAAGQEAEQLVQAVNRYGQTAVHIAARKGSPALLRSLVDAGGAASLLMADCDGKTAAEVARHNRNVSGMRVLSDAGGQLRREQQRQRGMVPTAERPRPTDHPHHMLRHQQQAPQQHWVGRRLQQRKGSGGGGGGGAPGPSSSTQ